MCKRGTCYEPYIIGGYICGTLSNVEQPTEEYGIVVKMVFKAQSRRGLFSREGIQNKTEILCVSAGGGRTRGDDNHSPQGIRSNEEHRCHLRIGAT